MKGGYKNPLNLSFSGLSETSLFSFKKEEELHSNRESNNTLSPLLQENNSNDSKQVISKDYQSNYLPIEFRLPNGSIKISKVDLLDIETFSILMCLAKRCLTGLGFKSLELLNLEFYAYNETISFKQKIRDQISSEELLVILVNMNTEDFLICKINEEVNDSHPHKRCLERLCELLIEYTSKILRTEEKLGDGIPNNLANNKDFLVISTYFKKKLENIKDEEYLKDIQDKDVERLLGYIDSTFEHYETKMENLDEELNNEIYKDYASIKEEMKKGIENSDYNTLENLITNEFQDFKLEAIKLAEKFKSIIE